MAEQDHLALWSEYGDLYNEIVRPERKYTISHYLRTQWGPLLGATRLWFVIALRQRCYWNKKQDWCVVDKRTLARESGLSLRTVNRIISAGEPSPPSQLPNRPTTPDYTSWFFAKECRRRYSERIGKTVNAPNRYRVLLDDPLTPRDQARLRRTLRQEVTDGSPSTTLGVLRELCACSDAELSDRLSPVEKTEESGDSDRVLPAAFVFDIVQDCCPMPPPESAEYVDIARASSRLHNTLTHPEHVYIGNQYFRLNWLPILGPALASLVVNLRARCYWNERTGELRDICRSSWSSLAQEIGCTARQLRNLRRKPEFAGFMTILTEGHGRSSSQFRVQMLDPLIETDRQRFETLCVATHSHDIHDVPMDPETGQLNMHALLNAEISAHRDGFPIEPTDQVNKQLLPSNAEIMTPRGKDKEETLALSGRKSWHVEGIKAEILARQSGSSGTCTKLHLITFSPKGLVETTLDVSSAALADERLLADALLGKLFDQLTVQEPNKSRLAARRPRCDWVAAWALYALTQPGLSQNKVGYVYKRLMEGNPPPADYMSLAGLGPLEWRALYYAMRSGWAESVPEELEDAYALCADLFAAVWEHLSFSFLPDHTQERTEPVVEDPAGRGGASWPSGRDAGDGPEEQAVPYPQAVPEPVRSLLLGDEIVEQEDGRLVIVTPSLYRAYLLARAAGQLAEECPVSVFLSDRGGREHSLNAEILALGIEPLSERDWNVTLRELRGRMAFSTFEYWWRDVLPLGVTHDPDECVLLGAFAAHVREWLEARHQIIAERALSGILGRPVRVRFLLCVIEGEAMPAFS
jgi:hypothetical protein